MRDLRAVWQREVPNRRTVGERSIARESNPRSPLRRRSKQRQSVLPSRSCVSQSAVSIAPNKRRRKQMPVSTGGVRAGFDPWRLSETDSSSGSYVAFLHYRATWTLYNAPMVRETRVKRPMHRDAQTVEQQLKPSVADSQLGGIVLQRQLRRRDRIPFKVMSRSHVPEPALGSPWADRRRGVARTRARTAAPSTKRPHRRRWPDPRHEDRNCPHGR